jgi:hypothetical protein
VAFGSIPAAHILTVYDAETRLQGCCSKRITAGRPVKVSFRGRKVTLCARSKWFWHPANSVLPRWMPGRLHTIRVTQMD